MDTDNKKCDVWSRSSKRKVIADQRRKRDYFIRTPSFHSNRRPFRFTARCVFDDIGELDPSTSYRSGRTVKKRFWAFDGESEFLRPLRQRGTNTTPVLQCGKTPPRDNNKSNRSQPNSKRKSVGRPFVNIDNGKRNELTGDGRDSENRRQNGRKPSAGCDAGKMDGSEWTSILSERYDGLKTNCLRQRNTHRPPTADLSANTTVVTSYCIYLRVNQSVSITRPETLEANSKNSKIVKILDDWKTILNDLQSVFFVDCRRLWFIT